MLINKQTNVALSQRGSAGLLPLIAVSLLLHLALFAVFTFGWQGETIRQPTKVSPTYIRAELVQLKAKPKTKAKKKPIKKPKIIDLTKKKRAQEKARQLAQKKKLAKKKIDRDKAAKDLAQKKKLARAEKLKEKLARDKVAREKAARQLMAEEERQQRELFDRELAAEEAELLEQLVADQDEVLVQSQTAIIKRKIESHWSRPPSARRGMECILSIQLVPTGRVSSVTVIKSSGNAAFDLSAERAVKKAEQFPDLKSLPPEVFERQFRRFQLRFNPKDLRL